MQWFTDAGDASKTLEDRADDLKSAFDAYKTSADLANLAAGDAAAKFGIAAVNASKYHEAMAGINRMSLEQQFNATGRGLLERLDANYGREGGMWANERGVADFFNLGGVDLGKRAKETRIEVQGLIADLSDFAGATTIEDRITSMEAAFEKARSFADRDGRVSEGEGSEREVLDTMVATLEILQQLRGEEEKAGRSRIDMAQKYYVDSRQQGEVLLRNATEEIDLLNRQAEMKRLVSMFGADSVQVTRARVQAERDAKAELTESAYGASSLADGIMAAWDNANGVAAVDMDGKITLATNATWSWVDAMASVGAELSGILSMITSLGGGMIGNAGKRVELEALQQGKSVAAATRARKEFEIGFEYDTKSNMATGWREKVEAEAGRRIALEQLDLDEQLGTERIAANKRDHESSKKGGTKRNSYEKDVFSIQAETEAFLAQADAMAKVVAAGGDWERALKVIEEEQNLLTEAQRAGLKLTPELKDKIHGMAEAYVDAEEKLENLRNATENGQDAFRDLFGSALDGADAAREAIANLIAEMAKVQFTKGMMGLLGGTSWGSSLIQGVGSLLSYDGGGYTGDDARVGGLDGKGGYMAMVHPQETIIDHTKGQSLPGGGMSVQVVPSPYFDVRVAQTSAGVASQYTKASARSLDRQSQNYQMRRTTV